MVTNYCSGDQIGNNEMGGHVARMERDEVHTGFTSVTLCKYTTSRADVNICQYGTVQ